MLVVVAVVGLIIVLVLGVAQVVLPGVAARRLRDQLARSGDVHNVQVDAFPAIKLLWHQADKVVVALGDYQTAPGRIGGLLDQVGDVGTLQASAAEVRDGLLTLRDATLTKQGDELRARARVTEADLRTALPILQSVNPVASSDGRLVLRGTATLFGASVTVDAVAGAQDGKLVVVPEVPFGGLATVTVFSDPRIAVQSVSAAPAAGGFVMSATAKVR